MFFKTDLEKQMDLVQKLVKKSKNEDLEEMLKYHFNNQEFRNDRFLKREYGDNRRMIVETVGNGIKKYYGNYQGTEFSKKEKEKKDKIEQLKAEVLNLEKEIEEIKTEFENGYYKTKDYEIEREVTKLLELHDQELKRIFEEE